VVVRLTDATAEDLDAMRAQIQAEDKGRAAGSDNLPPLSVQTPDARVVEKPKQAERKGGAVPVVA